MTVLQCCKIVRLQGCKAAAHSSAPADRSRSLSAYACVYILSVQPQSRRSEIDDTVLGRTDLLAVVTHPKPTLFQVFAGRTFPEFQKRIRRHNSTVATGDHPGIGEKWCVWLSVKFVFAVHNKPLYNKIILIKYKYIKFLCNIFFQIVDFVVILRFLCYT